MRNRIKSAAFGAAIILAVSSSRAAVFNFDSIPTGSFANAASADGTTFEPAVFGPSLDLNGDPIEGTDHWQVDLSGDPVRVVDPTIVYDRPPAPSPANAMDALFQPALVVFSATRDLSSFRVSLDNDTFGQPLEAALQVQFLNADGSVLAFSLVDQTVPGFLVTSGPVAGVKSILLPAGALYDNIAINEPAPVPESEWFTFAAGLVLIGFSFIRRRQSAAC